jgi:hypothetical protein
MNNSSNKQEAKAMARAASRDLTLQNKSKQENSADDWRGICSSGCYKAKSDKKKCKCKCQGKLHGKAYAENIEETEINRIANKSDQE